MKVKTTIIFFFIMMMAVSVFGMENATLLYRESTGQTHERVPYVLSYNGDHIRIEADFNEEYQTIVTDTDMNTKELTISYREKSRVIVIHREHDRLIIEGGVSKSVHVDPDIPWYQFLVNLNSFVLSGTKRTNFYTLSANFDERISRGKGIQVFRLVAKREGQETLEINGLEVETVKVMITFDDLRSLFWKAHYWYRQNDGTLVQYREVRGGPGTPETIGTLIEE
jgi:hypothetical protein